MKNFLKKYRLTIIKGLIIIAVAVVITLITYLILRLCGFTTVEDFQALKDRLGDSVWFWIIIAILQVIQVIFIPISNQIVTVPVAIVFNDQLWKVWITSWISIWVSTVILYWIGRLGGEKILKWLLNDDEEQTKKIIAWLNRGWIFYPLGMLLPLPDDIVTILSGTAKMNSWFIMFASLITRGIDTAFSVYGYGLLSRYWWGWIVVSLAWVLFAVLTYIVWKINENRKKAKKEEEIEKLD
ncbi:MAG TPA: hypothetical protein GX010_03410 [Erysipelotrichaceae bacterium]|nr:hypothetical protein [Erysipelotrichaceae bacterium]